MQKQGLSFYLAALPLFLAILIDGAGLGLLFPVLNAVMIDPNSHFLTNTVSESTRNILYGIAVSSFMFFWFFGAAILGDLSDAIGRRKALIICLVGSAVGYWLTAIAILHHSYILLLIGRIIDGFTAGSQPIAQAGIIDLSDKEHKTRNLSYIMFAASLGFIIGPLCGAYLADSSLVSWFNYATPMYFAAFLAIVNVVLLFVFFKETSHTKRAIELRLSHAIHLFIAAFKHKGIRRLSITFWFFMLGWSSYFTFNSMFLMKKYGYGSTSIGLFWAVLACGFGLGSVYLVGFLNNRFRTKTIIGVTLLITAFGIFVILTTPWEAVAWIVNFIVGASACVAYTTIISVFSNQVGQDEQGWVMGITGSIMALACATMMFIGGFFANINVSSPLYIGASVILIAVTLALSSKKIGMVQSDATSS